MPVGCEDLSCPMIASSMGRTTNVCNAPMLERRMFHGDGVRLAPMIPNATANGIVKLSRKWLAGTSADFTATSFPVSAPVEWTCLLQEPLHLLLPLCFFSRPLVPMFCPGKEAVLDPFQRGKGFLPRTSSNCLPIAICMVPALKCHVSLAIRPSVVWSFAGGRCDVL